MTTSAPPRPEPAPLATAPAARLAGVPGCATAADQPFRPFDPAAGPREDAAAARVAAVLRAGGAGATISSIHVNAWIGARDTLSGVRHLFGAPRGPGPAAALDRMAGAGGSPNDAPMSAAVPLAVGVADVRTFLDATPRQPVYVTRDAAGAGFVEFARAPLAAKAGTGGDR